MGESLIYSIVGSYKSVIEADPSVSDFRTAIKTEDTAIAARALGKMYFQATQLIEKNTLDEGITSALVEMGVDPNGAKSFFHQAFDMYSKKGAQRQSESRRIMDRFKARSMGKPTPVPVNNVPEELEVISPQEALLMMGKAGPSNYEAGVLPEDTSEKDYGSVPPQSLEAVSRQASTVNQIPSPSNILPIPDTGAEYEQVGGNNDSVLGEEYQPHKRKRLRGRKRTENPDNETPDEKPLRSKYQKPKKMSFLKKGFLAWTIFNTIWCGASTVHYFFPKSREFLGKETLGVVGTGIEATSGLLESIVGKV